MASPAATVSVELEEKPHIDKNENECQAGEDTTAAGAEVGVTGPETGKQTPTAATVAPNTPSEPRESVADEWRACWLDRITFGWLGPLISLGFERPLMHNDLGALPEWDRVHQHLDAFSAARDIAAGEIVDPEKVCCNATVTAMSRTFYGRMLAGLACKLIGDACSFAPPLALKWIIEYAETPYGRLSEEQLGLPLIVWVLVLLTIAGMMQGLMYHWFYHHVMVDGLHARTALQAGLYRKLLELQQPEQRREQKAGEAEEAAKAEPGTLALLNLQSQDAKQVEDVFWMCVYLVVVPIQLVIILVLLYMELG